MWHFTNIRLGQGGEWATSLWENGQHRTNWSEVLGYYLFPQPIPHSFGTQLNLTQGRVFFLVLIMSTRNPSVAIETFWIRWRAGLTTRSWSAS